MKRSYFALWVVMLLSACSSLPDELQTQSQSEETLVTSYRQWVQSQKAFAEQPTDIRLGGVITQITNLEKQTRLEIANLPISKTGRPDIDASPQGRFVAYVDGFLDPINYPKGQLITVVGQTMPSEQGKVGNYNYTFPVMKAYGQRLWHIEESTYVDTGFWMPHCMYMRGPCRPMPRPIYIYKNRSVQ